MYRSASFSSPPTPLSRRKFFLCYTSVNTHFGRIKLNSRPMQRYIRKLYHTFVLNTLTFLSMKSVPLYLGLVAALFAANCRPSNTVTENTPSPLMSMIEKNLPAPVAVQKPKELSIHGDIRQDPYYWLNDRNDAEVIQYLTDENSYLDQTDRYVCALQG